MGTDLTSNVLSVPCCVNLLRLIPLFNGQFHGNLFICSLNLSYHIGKRIYPDFEWRIETERSEVFLTFDDGPHPEITAWVLDQLNEYSAKATFFVVGENAKRYPGLIDRIMAEGHAVGNHTNKHLKGWDVSADDYLRDIRQCAEFIPKTDLFRPPYGRMNRQASLEMSEYRIIMWDTLTRDYKPSLNRRMSLSRICAQTVPGSIVVFHDSRKAWHNLQELLPAYLEFLKKNGFRSMAL